MFLIFVALLPVVGLFGELHAYELVGAHLVGRVAVAELWVAVQLEGACGLL